MKKKDIQPLVAKTRVVELKKEFDYLFIFDQTSGIEKEEISGLFDLLKEVGINGIGLYLKTQKGLEVYEVEKSKV